MLLRHSHKLLERGDEPDDVLLDGAVLVHVVRAQVRHDRLADRTREIVVGDFDLEGATVEGDRVTLSFTTLDGMDSFVALCLRPSPDGLSERIAGENEDGEKVEEPWRYTIRPNSI